jgi:ABC-type antimicrobial peptide transport system permease subunit
MFGKKKREGDDFDEEIKAHIQLEADQLVKEGMNPREAEAAARRAFGNVTSSRERFYESGRWVSLDHLKVDIRYALRRIRKSPVWSATVILSLALGIGFNTAIFSLTDQALLRALPVREPERLVLLDWNGSFVGGGYGFEHLLPHLFYRDLRKENDVFEDVFARFPTEVQLKTDGESEPAEAEIVSGSYFPTLGVRPAVGRLLGDEDDLQPDAHPVVVLAFDYWKNRLAGDPNIVGKRVLLNNYPMTVVGVAEQGFHGVEWSRAPAIWVPIMMKRVATPTWNALQDRRTRWLNVFGRLKPGVSPEQATTRLQPWFKAYLQADTQREGWPQTTPVQMREYMASALDLLPGAAGYSFMRRMMRQPMLVLLAATALILLLACLNVANLSLAKAFAAQRATALRVALGASRRRILTEQLVESSLLAAAGCLSGVPDLRILLFALTITGLATLLSGAAPALYAASIQPLNALKQQSNAVAGGLGLRKALVVGQFALASILLIGAGLFARTLANFRAQGPGFPTTNLLMARVDAAASGFKAAESKPLIKRLLTEIRSTPEVESAGVGQSELLTGGGWNNPVTVQSREKFVTENMAMNAISPGFFEAIGAPVIRGRDFNERDSTEDTKWSLQSAIVNEEFVKRYFRDADPLGARVGIGSVPSIVPDIEIVGVVKTFQDFGLRTPAPEIFFPLWQRDVSRGAFYIRTRGSSQAAASSIRAAVRRTDPNLSALTFRTVDDQLDRLLISERMLSVLAGIFAAVATFLAMIGLYGVLSFSAASRVKEIGVRLALGASRWEAGGMIIREAAVLAVSGLAIALPASWALGRLIESQLFGVRPMDILTIISAGGILTLVCLVASAVPARKAALVSPLEALKGD